ncbi:vacuolar protein-sorting-associated protein 36-like [Mercenaria mercenaria]|uniref:vacuolar protein-sorting-associated protein 36-like n=1 Tax=Mercenaria mercenaria TaxID=6596 RepID=UPI001E1D3DFF|nr:vacuolar protein-sorting-associated protein 36-like [Mercenaria mercenaria]
MNRFQWGETTADLGEIHVTSQTGVALYDGEDKTNFVGGVLSLTSHRLLWRDSHAKTSALCIPLSLVVYLEEQPSGFAKSAKIIVHLQEPVPGHPAGPISYSKHSYIRLSFRESGAPEFFRYFNQMLQEKKWEEKVLPPSRPGAQGGRHRPGIVGIERSIQQKQKQTDSSINQSFQDLKKLMGKAQEMVTLSKSIVSKIKDRQGEITEDETVKFKAYLLSMGIPNPVTRETHGTGDKYYHELARELAKVLDKPIKECGGMMTLTDVYCRVNRARGMELLSPEDLLNACEMFEYLRLPIRFRTFDSGVKVLQSSTHSEEEVIKKTTSAVEEKGSLTAEELAQLIGLSVILSKERLLLTERVGGVCRDDSEEGLRFYPNLFLTKT